MVSASWAERSQEKPDLRTPWASTSSFQKCEKRHSCYLGSPGKRIHSGSRESGHKPEEPLTCSWQTQSRGQSPGRDPQRGFGIRASPRGRSVRRSEAHDEGWGGGRRAGWIPETGSKLLAGTLNALSRRFVHVGWGQGRRPAGSYLQSLRLNRHKGWMCRRQKAEILINFYIVLWACVVFNSRVLMSLEANKPDVSQV